MRQVLRTLAHPRRQALLIALGARPTDVGTLSREVGATVSWVSRALHSLHKQSLVRSTAQGRRRIYRVSPRVNVERSARSVMIEVKCAPGLLVRVQAPSVNGKRSGSRRP